MEYVTLGNTDIKFPSLTVGCMSFGKAGDINKNGYWIMMIRRMLSIGH